MTPPEKIPHPRLLFLALLRQAVRDELSASVRDTGVLERLGRALSPVENWHLSLAGEIADTASNLAAALAVGDAIRATAFRLRLVTLAGSGQRSPIHWELRPAQQPRELKPLQDSIRISLLAQGVTPDGNPGRAHITISYWAPVSVPTTPIRPVDWLVDEFMLVRGGGRLPYRYEVLRRWPLAAPIEPQLSLL